MAMQYAGIDMPKVSPCTAYSEQERENKFVDQKIYPILILVTGVSRIRSLLAISGGTFAHTTHCISKKAETEDPENSGK
jgi:hypothetical protein